MACEICGRGNCTRSFHSLEEQERHDTRKEYEARGECFDCSEHEEEIERLEEKVERLREALLAIQQRADENQNDRETVYAMYHLAANALKED